MALVDLDSAFQRFFAGTGGYPRPRRRLRNDSFTFPDPEQVRVDVGRGVLILPKFGRAARDNGTIRAVFHRQLEGRVRRVTIRRDALVRQRPSRSPGSARAETGGDHGGGGDRRGPRRGGAGRHLEWGPPRRPGVDGPGPAQAQAAPEEAGPDAARSKHRLKALTRLRAKTAKLTRRRRDTTHQITSKLAKNHCVVVIEDLKLGHDRLREGDRSGAGPNVAQKAGLNRAILDVSWGEIERQFTYKLAWRVPGPVPVHPLRSRGGRRRERRDRNPETGAHRPQTPSPAGTAGAAR